MVKFMRFLSYNSLLSFVVLTSCCFTALSFTAGCRQGNGNSGGNEKLKQGTEQSGSLSSAKVAGSSEPVNLAVKDFSFMKEGDRIIALASRKPSDKRIELISSYFLGRKYRPDTKKRIKKQRKAEKSEKVKEEATNSSPLPVKVLATSFQYLDCMTYVEHVLALASVEYSPPVNRSTKDSEKATEKLSMASISPWRDLFLNRLIDVMFDAGGKPLMNHMRSHFVSMWARRNARKGYLTDIARGHKDARVRKVVLNKVKENRTFYVEDSFMIFSEAENIHYFTVDTLLKDSSILKSGDVLALVTGKEGLDVIHMGFYIEKSEGGTKGKKSIFRHASFSDNKIIDSDFSDYMTGRKKLVGLMALRPNLKAPRPISYEVADKSKVGVSNKAGVSKKAGISNKPGISNKAGGNER